jgi:hypothetical protein
MVHEHGVCNYNLGLKNRPIISERSQSRTAVLLMSIQRSRLSSPVRYAFQWVKKRTSFSTVPSRPQSRRQGCLLMSFCGNRSQICSFIGNLYITILLLYLTKFSTVIQPTQTIPLPSTAPGSPLHLRPVKQDLSCKSTGR